MIAAGPLRYLQERVTKVMLRVLVIAHGAQFARKNRPDCQSFAQSPRLVLPGQAVHRLPSLRRRGCERPESLPCTSPWPLLA